MGIIFLAKQKVKTPNYTEPSVRIGFNGVFSLNASAKLLLNIGANDIVNFGYDEESRAYFLYKCLENEEGYTLREKSKKDWISFSSSSLSKRIVEDWRLDAMGAKSDTRKISDTPELVDGRKLYLIIMPKPI